MILENLTNEANIDFWEIYFGIDKFVEKLTYPLNMLEINSF